ncbi:hypothetical protein KTD19_08400 [Burkholderia multivorans]|uniref:hypothetical protein n=1 Tax=Burkholderia multivorans TaxID=87883 RepID=UPI0011B2000B|nr:hypothetical protein [Burkholderia multivorans]MBU9232406.1 hypothetical protein [Burkholderia multivorans]MBU9293916.1 hypothetical protein [Burkholderia multivorans]MDN7864207.1 hypothetical protein [Burkholderia multivorans]QGR93119.1 hypothetical protein FOC30_19540 [Burkholderia multivorans]HEF4737836.1 hypothetical protein [Burkholderia multivorans]
MPTIQEARGAIDLGSILRALAYQRLAKVQRVSIGGISGSPQRMRAVSTAPPARRDRRPIPAILAAVPF